MKKKKTPEMPSTQQLEAELNRVKYRSRYRSVFRSTVYTLITVAAVSILVASSWLIRCNKSGERKSTIQTEPAV